MKLIVSRHPAAIEFIRQEMPEFADAPLLASATADDVQGKEVAGVLPMHLAALTHRFYAVEFNTPPRGAEYTIEEMRAAGARITPYAVARPGDVLIRFEDLDKVFKNLAMDSADLPFIDVQREYTVRPKVPHICGRCGNPKWVPDWCDSCWALTDPEKF